VTHRLHQEEVVLEELRAEVQAYDADFDAMQGTTFPSENLKMMYRAYCHLRAQMKQQEIAAQHAATDVSTTQQELLKAQQKEQVLRKLKERGSRRYDAEHISYEQRLLDDLTIARFRYEYAAPPNNRIA
jgi:flagellar export protein FliJ